MEEAAHLPVDKPPNQMLRSPTRAAVVVETGGIVAAKGKKNRSNACCCKWRNECQDVKKIFEDANDSHGRGLRAFAIGWHASSLSKCSKTAFADCLGISIAACDELSKGNKKGEIYVNRLHYDPRQLDLFSSNKHARRTLLPWCEMKAFTNVFEERGSITQHKKQKVIDHAGEDKISRCFRHYPNYPFALAKHDAHECTSSHPKDASAKRSHSELSQEMHNQQSKIIPAVTMIQRSSILPTTTGASYDSSDVSFDENIWDEPPPHENILWDDPEYEELDFDD